MSVNNSNTIIALDTNDPVPTSVVKITGIRLVEETSTLYTFKTDFNFYLDETKFTEDPGLAIKVLGLEDKNYLHIDYDYNADGPDLMLHLYTKVVAYILTLFPSWIPGDLVINTSTT